MAEDTRDRGLHRHGDPDPSKWDEQQVVTDRPQDEPVANSTFADRAKARKPAAKAVKSDEVEDKATKPAATKSTPAKKAARKRS